MEFSRVILRKDGKRVRCSRSFVRRSLYLVARDVSKLDASFYLDHHVSHEFPRGDTRVRYDPPLWNFNCRAGKRLVSFSPCITRFRRGTSIHPQLGSLPIRLRIFFYFTAPPSSHGFQRKRVSLALSLTDLFSVVESIYALFSILAPLFRGISLESLYAENCVSRAMDMNDREILFLTILLRSNEYVDESRTTNVLMRLM